MKDVPCGHSLFLKKVDRKKYYARRHGCVIFVYKWNSRVDLWVSFMILCHKDVYVGFGNLQMLSY